MNITDAAKRKAQALYDEHMHLDGQAILARHLQQTSDVAKAANLLRHHDDCMSPAHIPDVCSCGLSQFLKSLQSLILDDEPDPLDIALTNYGMVAGGRGGSVGEQLRKHLACYGLKIVQSDD